MKGWGLSTYSEEEGTFSARHYTDDIPEDVKRARLDELMELQESIAAEINTGKIGEVLQVIVDREEDDYYVGRTEYDSPEVDPEVLISKDTPLNIGEFYKVRITDAMPFELIAELV